MEQRKASGSVSLGKVIHYNGVAEWNLSHCQKTLGSFSGIALRKSKHSVRSNSNCITIAAPIPPHRAIMSDIGWCLGWELEWRNMQTPSLSEPSALACFSRNHSQKLKHHQNWNRCQKNRHRNTFRFSKKLVTNKLLEWSNSASKLLKDYFGPNFLDPKITPPKLFQTQCTRSLRIFWAFANSFKTSYDCATNTNRITNWIQIQIQM